jgi:hypothetical protein
LLLLLLLPLPLPLPVFAIILSEAKAPVFAFACFLFVISGGDLLLPLPLSGKRQLPFLYQPRETLHNYSF